MKGLSSENLAIGYDRILIDQICLSVKEGEILTLIGPNGCGKSTLLKTLTGQLKKKGGVIFLGEENRENIGIKETAKMMSMVTTERIHPELMTCAEVVEAGRYPYTGNLGILSEEDTKKVRLAMEMTNTLDLANRDFMTLSDGQKQRILLAKAICQEPEILILDEPTSYLDIRYKIEILMQIKKLAKEQNMAVIMSLHELEIAMRISDYVVALGDGKILGTGRVEEIFKEEFIRKLYGIEGEDISLIGTVPWMEETKSGDAINFSDSGKEAVSADCSKPEAKPEKEMNLPKETKRPKVIMIQGTMSNAGKSIIAAGLCRIFTNDGYRVAPFKSQNMALNSYVTEDGKEMGRAQVVQAECCKRKPDVNMNPILLKPTGVTGSQVIVGGKVQGNMSAGEYFRQKTSYIPAIMEAFETLSGDADIIVVEGAGSPVEMNLKKDDIVNMGLAKLLDASVLLVGDIDRGGIFAQLLGTLDLLDEEERKRVKGLIVNKFRGDKSLFDSGVEFLKGRGKTDVLGVVPYMQLEIDDEDSLAEKLGQSKLNQNCKIDVSVIRLPYISNFTDFYPFAQLPEVSLRFVNRPDEIGNTDLLILPGSKNTIHDLKWLKTQGFDALIRNKKEEGCVILGICGGFQMLGESVWDPDHVESSQSDSETGLGLLAMKTVLGKEKKQVLFEGNIKGAAGELELLKGISVNGYEIHMGETLATGDITEFTSGQTGYYSGNIYGTYVHGLFDSREVLKGFALALAKKKNVELKIDEVLDYADYREAQYEALSANLRESLDMEKIYKILGLKT
ncbi:MAG: cobyric acid synthase [Lachnospiraceae bacterium]|nr:cobyric acid synthase [Lachnospiraceae bacterium]